MRVVELLGIPGSGKTTLARELVRSVSGAVALEDAVHAAVRDRGEDPLARTVARLPRSSSGRLWRSSYSRSTDRFSGLTSFLGANPQTMEAVLAGQRSRKDRDLGQDLVLGWLLNLMARYQLATERSTAEWLVIDEGFCQRGVALFSHGFVPADLEMLDIYVGSIPQPDVVVVVDTPLEICESRLDQRGWSERVRHLPIGARREFLAGAAATTNATAQRLETSGVEIARIDGAASIQSSLVKLTSALGNEAQRE